jgi:hypothetical protein
MSYYCSIGGRMKGGGRGVAILALNQDHRFLLLLVVVALRRRNSTRLHVEILE